MSAYVEIYQKKPLFAPRAQHRWRVRSTGNSEILSMASEGYANEAEMIAAMRLTHEALGHFLSGVVQSR